MMRVIQLLHGISSQSCSKNKEKKYKTKPVAPLFVAYRSLSFAHIFANIVASRLSNYYVWRICSCRHKSRLALSTLTSYRINKHTIDGNIDVLHYDLANVLNRYNYSTFLARTQLPWMRAQLRNPTTPSRWWPRNQLPFNKSYYTQEPHIHASLDEMTKPFRGGDFQTASKSFFGHLNRSHRIVNGVRYERNWCCVLCGVNYIGYDCMQRNPHSLMSRIIPYLNNVVTMRRVIVVHVAATTCHRLDCHNIEIVYLSIYLLVRTQL